MSGYEDFWLEKALLGLGVVERKLRLSQMEPNTPSGCKCGRSLNEHLEDEVGVLEMLEELFNGKPLRFREFITKAPWKKVAAAKIMASSFDRFTAVDTLIMIDNAMSTYSHL